LAEREREVRGRVFKQILKIEIDKRKRKRVFLKKLFNTQLNAEK
jgi:hypothetical protein